MALKPFWEQARIPISRDDYVAKKVIMRNGSPFVVVIIEIFHHKRPKKRNLKEIVVICLKLLIKIY